MYVKVDVNACSAFEEAGITWMRIGFKTKVKTGAILLDKDHPEIHVGPLGGVWIRLGQEAKKVKLAGKKKKKKRR